MSNFSFNNLASTSFTSTSANYLRPYDIYKVNKNKLYAVCDEIGKPFFLWQEDTRIGNDCPYFDYKSLDQS